MRNIAKTVLVLESKSSKRKEKFYLFTKAVLLFHYHLHLRWPLGCIISSNASQQGPNCSFVSILFNYNSGRKASVF